LSLKNSLSLNEWSVEFPIYSNDLDSIRFQKEQFKDMPELPQQQTFNWVVWKEKQPPHIRQMWYERSNVLEEGEELVPPTFGITLLGSSHGTKENF